jgi:hypothetical protein
MFGISAGGEYAHAALSGLFKEAHLSVARTEPISAQADRDLARFLSLGFQRGRRRW